ncbi:hypothetical protein Ancab_039232 [Ancistrocladus abbreviatus]
MADRKKQPIDYNGRLKSRAITTSTRSRQEDQHPPKRIGILPPMLPAPTPLTPTTTPSTPCHAVHVPIAPFMVPIAPFMVPITITPMLWVANLMPNRATIGSLTLDYLIDEIKLALHTNISAEGDATDAKVKIDDLAATEGATYDNARAATLFSYSFWRRRGF